MNILQNQESIFRRLAEDLLQPFLRRAHQIEEELHSIFSQSLYRRINFFRLEGDVMDARAEVADELLCGPGGFPADKRSNTGGEDHGKVRRGEAGYTGDGIEALHINGEIKIVVGEPHELQYGRIAILSPDPGGGVVQPANIAEIEGWQSDRLVCIFQSMLRLSGEE